MSYERCKTCREWGYADSHKCPPIWEVRIYETKWQEDWHEVHASDAERAAQKFAENYDCQGDYDIVKRGSTEVEVRKQGDDQIAHVDISAEAVPHYYAHVRKRALTSED